MGSRIYIYLSEFLLNKYVEVRLTSHEVVLDEEAGSVSVESVARVIFHVFNCDSVEYVFDVDSHEGAVVLSRDFNYFRYEEGSPERALLRRCYEAGVCFEVIH